MTLASAEQLFAMAGKRRFTETTLPVAGATVRIRSLTERELSTFQARIVSAKDARQRSARLMEANRRLIAMCLVDADGNALLADADLDRLAELDAADSQALYDACAAHTGINKADVEDLVKNSETTPPSGSPSS
jgi:hypothetical protein